jgi:tetratricopeptide (TPR) repeat protein
MIAAALSAASVSGCKNGVSIPIWNPFAKPVPSSGLVQSGENEYVQPSMPKTPSQTESSWTAPFKKLGDTLSAPFKSDDDASANGSVSAKKPHDDAISLATKTGKPQPSLYVEVAKLHERAGKLSEAVSEYDKALDLDPKYQPALLGLARLYDRLGRYDEALIFYARAAQNGGDDAAVQNDYGLCQSRSGNDKDAVASLRKAVSLDPKKILYRNNLATVLVELGRTEEAYQTLVAVHGEAVAHYNVGFLLNKQGRKAEALAQFEQSAKIDPNLQEAKQWVIALGGKPGATPAVVADAPAAQSATAKADSSPPAHAAAIAAPRSAEAAPRQADVAPTAAAKPAVVASDDIPAPPKKPQTAERPQPAAVVEAPPRADLPRVETSQPKPAAKSEDRYVVASAAPETAPQPGPATGIVPPLPEQISKFDVAAPAKPASPATSAAKRDEARYPASRY